MTWRTSGRLVVLIAAVTLFCVQAPLLVVGHDLAVGPAIGLSLAHAAAAPLALWRSLPAGMLAVLASGAQMLVVMVDGVGGWPWAVAPMLTQMLVLVVLALVGDWPVVIGTLAASVIQTVVFVAIGLPWRPFVDSIANVALFLSLITMATALGAAAGRITTIADALRQERMISAEEQARRMVVEEKSRVARELHDVIAHNMSLITVQARSAPHRLSGMAPETAAEFEQIAAKSAEALAQMRGVLNVLRTEAGQSGRAPVPRWEQITELVDAVRDAGQEVHLVWHPPALGTVDEEVGAGAYRIVQEALSNSRRHAPGQPVEVELRTGGDAAVDRLELVVRNPHSFVGEPGVGHGLIGMRERAVAVGGTLEAGELQPGEYVVRARLPLRRQVEGESQ